MSDGYCDRCGRFGCSDGCPKSGPRITTREELIEAMARTSWAACPSVEAASYDEALAGDKGWMLQEIAEDEEPRASVLLPVAVEAVLARVEECVRWRGLHPADGCTCRLCEHDRIITAEIAAIRAEWGQSS